MEKAENNSCKLFLRFRSVLTHQSRMEWVAYNNDSEDEKVIFHLYIHTVFLKGHGSE